MPVSQSAAPLRRPIRNALHYLRRRRIVGAPLAALASGRAVAQAPWPQRPVRIVIPFGAGFAAAEAMTRGLAAHFSTAFGQSFVVENRPGAGGTIGAAEVARATDLHTLGVMAGGPTTTARALNPEVAYDPARDFRPISLLLRTWFVLTVAPDFPAADFTGFVAHVRANPGRYAYGSIGPGTVSHLLMEELKERLGLDLEHVSYRGFPQASLDLAAGRVAAVLNPNGVAVPQIAGGRLRGLFVSGATRLAQLPDVPSVAEAGIGWAEAYGWTGLVAPATFPDAPARRLAALSREVLQTDEALRRPLLAAGIEIVGSDPDVFAAFHDAEARRWIAVIQRLGLRVTD